MKETDAYLYLKEAFVSTFLKELLPGIFHNFANPLNGIMGRSQLMQRRLADFIARLHKRYPEMDAEMDERCRKLQSDMATITRESDDFLELFNLSTGKFYALDASDRGMLNLSRLVEAEMGFMDFYLDFKHNVKKDILIDSEMPDIYGVPSYYSMAVWALIRASMNTLADVRDAAFKIQTDHDERWASLSIQPVGGEILRWGPEGLPETLSETDVPQSLSPQQREMFYALRLLRQASAKCEIDYDAQSETLTLRIPGGRTSKEG
jgi:hypothetical protein